MNAFWVNFLSDRSIDQAEEYLCLVRKGKETQLKTFDEYRRNQLIKVGVPIVSLVSSSKCIRNGHIRRMFYLVKMQKHFPIIIVCTGGKGELFVTFCYPNRIDEVLFEFWLGKSPYMGSNIP